MHLAFIQALKTKLPMLIILVFVNQLILIIEAHDEQLNNNVEKYYHDSTSQHQKGGEKLLKTPTSVTRLTREFREPHSEALVLSLLDALTSTTFDQYYQDYVNDELCSISTVSRRPNGSNSTTSNIGGDILGSAISERALNCSKLDESNYNKIFKNINKRSKLSIQQIHFRETETLVVYPAIDLICNRLDCSNLTVLNITGHEIHQPETLRAKLNSWTKLEVLDLSYTYLTSIESILFNSSNSNGITNLESLILDTNLVTQLDFDYILKQAPNLKHLSLINNSIFDIKCNENSRGKLKNQFETINLAGNEINCDRSHLWFMKQFLNPNLNYKYPDYDKINCSQPVGLSDMTWSQRISVLETGICDDCECRSLKGVAISVDCHNKNLTSLPENLPLNTKVLNLTSNKIDNLRLPYNSRNWENVTYVYLENNLITSFQTLDTNLKFMRNLAALDIRRNKFQEFPSHIFEQFVNLDQVHLSNNPWLCDCEATFAFQEWLQRQFHKVNDKEEIMCGISGSEENGLRSHNTQQRLSARVIYKLSKSELCPQNNPEEPYDWLDLVNIILALIILLILSKVAADYIYQHRTKRLPHFFKLNY